jgi:hypothetical protein
MPPTETEHLGRERRPLWISAAADGAGSRKPRRTDSTRKVHLSPKPVSCHSRRNPTEGLRTVLDDKHAIIDSNQVTD